MFVLKCSFTVSIATSTFPQSGKVDAERRSVQGTKEDTETEY